MDFIIPKFHSHAHTYLDNLSFHLLRTTHPCHLQLIAFSLLIFLVRTTTNYLFKLLSSFLFSPPNSIILFYFFFLHLLPILFLHMITFSVSKFLIYYKWFIPTWVYLIPYLCKISITSPRKQQHIAHLKWFVYAWNLIIHFIQCCCVRHESRI